MSELTKNNSPWSIPVFAIKVTLVCLLVGFIALLTFLAKSGYFGQEADPGSNARMCLNHLRQIDAAANEFALEHSLRTGAPINFPDDLTPYINIGYPKLFMGCERAVWKARAADRE